MRDLLTWPQQMLKSLKGHEIILLDNGSTYPPLLHWYETCPHRVIRLSNVGCNAPWLHLADEMNEPYVVTDPDLDISGVPDDWHEKALRAMDITGETKVGLAIDTSGILPTSPARKHSPVMRPDLVNLDGMLLEGIPIVPLSVAHTFAVYAPGRQYAMDGVSLGRPYTARHLPWHEPINNEYQYYIDRANTDAQYATYLKGAHRG